MQKRMTGIVGALLVLAGVMLWLFARDTEFLWFRGGPLGIVLIVLGLVDLATMFAKDKERR
ncbi:hypothetical protein GV794_26205 [Nocardia cyriacigeorgica]|uniref:Uncharacterized protein n=1 Tax=Nocardia cyriacigeorgica TaxID=135487 RepID=A0A6P1D461_9NOCA|nr:hypothetical protein [Nocardia cyriacigeorgica]NEW40583.1 hypothetical protein [Nocardia cyriacigeorgica]NEW42962.1 hypothetical protein [Nocardia cyriacigeorgica]NEW53315.1 hypothetical protein [Nocardia cyriacigeorgica]NEW59104.1 hypothetical protein [Nocardia cyriacigeorgica]